MANEEYYRNLYNETAAYNYGSAAPEYIPGEHHADVYEKPVRKVKVGFGYYAFLIIAVVLIGISVSACLRMHSQITSSAKKAESLTSELHTLTVNNNAQEVYLNKSVDLNQVFEIATTELGMVYPGPDQIIFYQRSDMGYVRQYEDVPNS